MLRSIKDAVLRYLTEMPDPRDVDAMSMTLHHCVRLVYPQPQSESISSTTPAEQRTANMKWNLDSPQPRFIKPA
ncbi:hypothetical protein FF011L_02750 [Roseimaritima multifibrata]|uniref:Uncharacterized protein n=1 Tax=Roseimaritima multifibrata TaxID=1930274 RepID=A0A517M9I0_9BACT|nr:hypothetical protein [Roseimaritima multifibrata]QDS91545.1 hypothetical protein FF011L_02750 [Roseimaritima multifibrata]